MPKQWQVGDLTIVFFVSSLVGVEDMQRFVRIGVQPLIPEMQRSLLTYERADTGYRFVYYNEMNWALKVTR